jgi:ubiquitin carboxyl-terminal hydrolase 36/42
MGHHIRYDDHLSLQPVMSEGQYGPSYSLYGVICHAGGGPNSGHYYAYVKASNNRWYEMNDELVTPMRGAPVSLKSAYILFYVRAKGQALKAAVTTPSNHPPIPPKGGVATGMKKRKSTPSDDEDDKEDIGVTTTHPVIGPKLPPPSPQPELMRQIHNSSDPQADLVKKRIEAAAKKPGSALLNLSQYGGDSEESGKDEEGVKEANDYENDVPSSPLPPPTSSPLTSPSTIPPVFFYGKPENSKKRKSPDNERDENFRDPLRTPSRGYSSRLNRSTNDRARFSPKKFGNPYSRINNNLRGDRPPPTKKYGHAGRRVKF